MRKSMDKIMKEFGPLPTMAEKAASEDSHNERLAAELADAATDALYEYSPNAWLELTAEQQAALQRHIADKIKARLPAPYGDNLRRSGPATVAG